MLPFQDYILVIIVDNLKNAFLDSFEKIGNMPGEYLIVVDSSYPPVQHRRCRVQIGTINGSPAEEHDGTRHQSTTDRA